MSETRGKFRESLKAQDEVKWTGIAVGWLADYFLPRPEFENVHGTWETRTHIQPVPEMWPVDVRGWNAVIPGTGEEMVSWVFCRDIGRALVQLLKSEDWVSHPSRLYAADHQEPTTYLASEWSNMNAAISILESYYKRQMPRTTKPITQIQDSIDHKPWDSEESYAAQVEEMSFKGWLHLPKEEVMRQQEKYFHIEFRTLSEMLTRSGFI